MSARILLVTDEFMTGHFSSLDDLIAAVEFAIGDPLLRGIVITRVFVRTGVNLREVTDAQKHDRSIIDQIAHTFEELGYSLEEKK